MRRGTVSSVRTVRLQELFAVCIRSDTRIIGTDSGAFSGSWVIAKQILRAGSHRPAGEGLARLGLCPGNQGSQGMNAREKRMAHQDKIYVTSEGIS